MVEMTRYDDDGRTAPFLCVVHCGRAMISCADHEERLDFGYLDIGHEACARASLNEHHGALTLTKVDDDVWY